MNPITQAVKQKYPQYVNVDDDDLTLAIGQKYPQYLSHPQFSSDFQQVKNDAPMKAMMGQKAGSVVPQRQNQMLGAVNPISEVPRQIPKMSDVTGSLMNTEGMQPGVGKALAEQVTPLNVGLGIVGAPIAGLLSGSAIGRLLLGGGAAALGAQGAKNAGQAVGTIAGNPNMPSGQKHYLETQVLLSLAQAVPSLGLKQILEAPMVPKATMPRTVEEINKFNNLQPRKPKKVIQLGSSEQPKPSPFEKGKLMPNVSKPFNTKDFSAQGTETKPSESQPAITPKIEQPQSNASKAGGVTPPPALTFKPVIRYKGQIIESNEKQLENPHGLLAGGVMNAEASKFRRDNPTAKSADVAAFVNTVRNNIERGHLGSDGKWYATSLDVARAKMQEQKQPIKQNETEQMAETGSGRVSGERPLQEEVPGNGREGTGSNGEGGKQRPQETLNEKEQNEEQQRLSEALGDVQELDKYGGESGAVNVQAIKQGLQDLGTGIKEHVEPALKEGKEMFKRMVLRRSGEALPFHARADKELGNTAYLLGQSQGIANRLAEVDPKIVLQGEKEDLEFDKTLGAVWTEAQLRDKRSNLYAQGKDAEARAVETVVGNGRSPIQNEAQYNALLRNKKIQEATQDMRRLVGNKAQARQQNLKGKMSQIPGLGFVNLLVENAPARPVAGSGLRGAQLRGSAMNMQRSGTGTSYDVSATRIMQNMIKGKGNYYRSALADYYKEALKKGLGQWVQGGEKPPEGFVQIPQDITRLIVKDEDGSVNVSTQRKDFYLRKDLYPEFRRLTGLDHTPQDSLADFFTRLQVSAGIDALQHSGNVVTAFNGAAQGSLGKNIFGAREANTIYQLVKNVGQELQDDPEFLAVAHSMAKRGILRDVHSMKGLMQDVPVVGKALNFGGALIQHLDKAGRMAMYKEAVMLANKGLGKHDIIDIRRQIDKQFGQYNPRLMTAWQHIMRSVFSPFNVASKTFNNLAMQRVLMSPGFATANKQAWTKGAARQLAYAATAYFAAPMVINYEQTGQFFPEGVPFGAAVIGKNKDGTYKTFDFLKFTFARRGLRITGAGDIYEGQIKPRLEGEKPEDLNQTFHEAATDALRGQVAPYTTGPIPGAISVLLTGKTPLGYDQRQKGDTQSPYFAAAARQLNPVSGALSAGSATGNTMQPLTKRLEQAVGVGNSKTPTQIVQNFARQFLYKIGKAKQMEYEPGAESSLVTDLKQNNPDKAKEDYDALLQQKIEQHQFAADPENEAKRDLQRYFTSYAHRPVTGSKETEEAFIKQLSPHQQDLYGQMMEEQAKVSEEFFKLQAPMGKKPRGMSLRF